MVTKEQTGRETYLPDRLPRGMTLVSTGGCEVTVHPTSDVDSWGEPLVRLREVKSGVLGNQRGSRDELQKEGLQEVNTCP